MATPVVVDMSSVVTDAASALAGTGGITGYLAAGVGVLASILALRFGLRLFRSFVR